MQRKKFQGKFIMAGLISILALSTACNAQTHGKAQVNIKLDFEAPQKSISPYIFGINDRADLSKVSPKAIRLGGNRMTAYNWENNKSNAGSDWKNQTDDYILGNVRSSLKKNLPLLP